MLEGFHARKHIPLARAVDGSPGIRTSKDKIRDRPFDITARTFNVA